MKRTMFIGTAQMSGILLSLVLLLPPLTLVAVLSPVVRHWPLVFFGNKGEADMWEKVHMAKRPCM